MNHFLTLIEKLAKADVKFILVGGLAATVHGSSIVTQDVDICVQLGLENLKRIKNALADHSPKHRMHPKRLPFDDSLETLRTFKNLYLETELGQLDCLGEVLGLGKYEEILPQSQKIQLKDFSVSI